VLYYVWRNKKHSYAVVKIIHLNIAISGVVLLLYSAVIEYFEIAHKSLEATMEILGVWFVLLLVPGGISLILIAVIYWYESRIVIPTVLLTIFLAIFWFTQNLAGLLSIVFIFYAIVTLYIFLYRPSEDKSVRDND
jgi:hypothetical protein